MKKLSRNDVRRKAYLKRLARHAEALLKDCEDLLDCALGASVSARLRCRKAQLLEVGELLAALVEWDTTFYD